MTKRAPDQFSPEEAQRRFEAALRGARVTGHKEMADLSAKKRKAKKKARSKLTSR